ncbi:MAG: DUF4112 domain-containing protein [Sulfuricaulis sp.]|nr:DUF4112 domain-containing protein [Sulfuricaulis sp.]
MRQRAAMPPADAPQRRPVDARMRVHRLARLMDSSIRLPGGFRIGVDGLIGLVPVVGDLAAAGASFYIVAQAARAGVPASALARMVLNVALGIKGSEYLKLINDQIKYSDPLILEVVP